MYIDSWQLFLLSFAVGVLASIVIAVIIAICFYNKWLKDKKESEEKNATSDLMTRLCFVLLVKGLISDSDRDWMLNKIEFSEWKKLAEAELNNDKDSWYM